ncbi:MAG TPA: hypothetical protein VE867_06590 [Candidatus Binatia bacterium]|jgi:hypothetical protein|nr:hypothetical protein [Candidatus Binatia bacterium]
MNARIEPQQKRGMGCFGKGCLVLIILAILLVVVGVGGSYWSVRHVYLSDKPVPIPEPSASPETSAVTPGATSMATPAPSERSAAVRERLDTMKQAARAHEPNEVILTAADINALIAANRKSSGMASVGINGNVAQVLISIPLERLNVPLRDTFGLGDRYLNAVVTIVAPPGTNASNVQLSEVKVNGHRFPANLLDGGFLGVGPSLRSYVIKAASEYGITDGEIRDGKVILHTSGY